MIMELYLRYYGFYSMAAYCDFNEINGGKVVPYLFTYKECQQTVIFITNYKYENHVYWQTKVIFTLV